MVIKVQLSGVSVDLDHFFPVARSKRLIVFDKLKLIGEPTSDYKLVFTIGIVASDLFCDNSAVVFVQSDASDQTVN